MISKNGSGFREKDHAELLAGLEGRAAVAPNLTAAGVTS
jgi:hypothetical protein